MKYFITVTVLFFLFILSNAQFRFGPIAGISATHMSMEMNHTPWSSNMRVGFVAGGIAEFAINRDLSFQPGVLVCSKGHWYNINTTKIVNSIYYCELPLNFKYTKSKGMTDYGFYGGPYVGIAMGGSYNEIKTDGKTYPRSLDFGTDKIMDDFIRWDGGLNIGLCMETNNLQYNLQYGVGLLNISSKEQINFMYNRIISLSVAYLIKVR